MVQAKPTVPVFNTGDPLFASVIVAHPLTDGSGTTAADISGHSFTATLTGGATWFNDPTLGFVIQLDGTSGYLTLNAGLNAAIDGLVSGSTSVTMWLKLRNNVPVVATKTGLMDLGALTGTNVASKWPDTDGLGYLSVLRGGTINNTRVNAINLGATDKSGWHLVIITSQGGGNYELYINGVLITTTLASSPQSLIATITATLGRSTDTSGGPYYLDGWLGDFRVYSTEINAAQALSLFNSPWNLYTVTTPLGQSRIVETMGDLDPFGLISMRALYPQFDATPFKFREAARTAALMVDAVPYLDPTVSPTPPNSPGAAAFAMTNAFNPRLKPLNSGPPTLNADPVNTGTIFAVPFTEGGTTAPGSAPTAAASAGGAVTTGTHQWVYSYILASGEETGPSPVSNTLTIAGGTQTVSVTGITVGPVGTTARKLYRTLGGAAGSGIYFLVTTIADNTTTSFSDTIADGSLTTNGPKQVNDRSGNANNGAFNASVSWDTSVSSFFFKNRVKAPAISTGAGSGSYVRIARAAVLEPASAITLSAWVRPHAFPSNTIAPFISKLANNGAVRSYLLGCNNSGQFIFRMTDTIDGESTTLAGGSFPNSQAPGPYHVAATYDGALTNLYVNGVLVQSVGNSGNIQYSPTPGDLFIGGDTNNFNANADIDAVQIWSRALSLAEIKQFYSAQYAGVVTAGVPVTDAGSGAFGNYSNGALTDQVAVMVDASPFKQELCAREVVLMLDASSFKQELCAREVVLMADLVAAAQNVAGMGIGSITPNIGSFAGGTPVTIRGFYFRAVTAVFVGGVAVTSFTVVDQTTITAVTGAHVAGIVDVRVDSSVFGTVIAQNLFQYVGGLGPPSTGLARGKQLSTSLWHQDPPNSFYTGATIVAPPGVSTTLGFTLSDNPTTAQAVEVYVRHTGETGYGRMVYGVDYNVDITNKHIIWLGLTAQFGLISSDQMIVGYPGQH